MAYDAELADRIRFMIAAEPGVTEKKMFGGLAFLIGGNMAISASGQGGALVRVDPAESDALCQTTTATMAVMGGREMLGWLRISSTTWKPTIIFPDGSAGLSDTPGHCHRSASTGAR
jgi:hypothetical protein